MSGQRSQDRAQPAVRAQLQQAVLAAGRRVADGSIPDDPVPLGEDAQQAYAYVLRSTQHRPQTLAELRAKLQRRGIDAAAATAALFRAQQVGAIDDRAFARAWVEDRGTRRGYGRARLRQELRRRQVDDALIDEALTAIADRDDLAVATELAAAQARRYPSSLEPAAVARRLGSHLLRRGYSPAIAQRVAASVAGLDRSWD